MLLIVAVRTGVASRGRRGGRTVRPLGSHAGRPGGGGGRRELVDGADTHSTTLGRRYGRSTSCNPFRLFLNLEKHSLAFTWARKYSSAGFSQRLRAASSMGTGILSCKSR